MKLIDSRVISVRSARICLTLADGSSHVIDITNPVEGSVETVDDEIDVTTIEGPHKVLPGLTNVLVDLRGPLTSRRVIRVDP